MIADLSVNKGASCDADFHAKLLRGIGAVVVEEGDDERHEDHGAGAVHGLLVRHVRARLPVRQHHAQGHRLEWPAKLANVFRYSYNIKRKQSTLFQENQEKKD